MKFIVYNGATGKIVRTGHCQASTFDHQAGEGEFVIEGVANDVQQKINDGIVVDKTPEEIERDSPKTKPIPFEEQQANITNEQYQALLSRIEILEHTAKKPKKQSKL